MHFAIKYCKRENLHFYLVLVYHPFNVISGLSNLQVIIYSLECRYVIKLINRFERIVIVCVPSVRPHLLNARNRKSCKILFFCVENFHYMFLLGMVPREVASAVTRKTDIGDWWILYMLGRNLDPIIYRDVLIELAKRIEPLKPGKH